MQTEPTNFGLIHSEFELDNILWDQGIPGVIDFDDSGYSWFIADIAIAMRKMFDNQINRTEFDDERFQAFVEGYRSLRRIGNEDLINIPLFLRLHNLVTYAQVQRAILDEMAEDPQWLIDLRHELQDRLEQYRSNVSSYPIEPFYKSWKETISL